VVTKASQQSADPEQRDGFAFNLIAARKRNPVTDKKVWRM
jgi:hypothetical protein